MTGNPKIDTTRHSPCGTAGVCLEVPYGSENYQVRLWKLPPNGVVSQYPQPNVTHSWNLPVSGVVNIRRGCVVDIPPGGQCFEMTPDNRGQLENGGTEALVLLEVCWGGPFKPVSLPEVTETRPWGSFTVLKDEPAYKLKQLVAKPGNRLSLQRHEKREEHWFVTQGHPEVTLDDAKILPVAQQYVQIPRRGWHRLANPAPAGGADVEIIELQLGDYFGEDDIERREDDYGRV
jgi:mannose-6-phosphate isomerase